LKNENSVVNNVHISERGWCGFVPAALTSSFLATGQERSSEIRSAKFTARDRQAKKTKTNIENWL